MDNCNPDNCPVNAKVKSLKDEFDRYRDDARDDHEKMKGRIGKLETGKATQETQLSNIESRVISIEGTVNAIAGKSGKRWDGLIDKLIYAVALAVVAWVAAGMPGLK